MRVVIVTVHGTNDADRADDGARWWQHDSPFSSALAGRVQSLVEEAGESAQIEVAPFHWSGENSETERRDAGIRLARFVHKTRKDGRPDHLTVLAHSHGGNVVVHALRRRMNRHREADDIICLGSPFFRRRPKLQALVLWASIPFALTAAAVLAAYFAFADGEDRVVSQPWGWLFAVAIIAGAVLCVRVWFDTPYWVLRRRTPPICCIWARLDEAIRGLSLPRTSRPALISHNALFTLGAGAAAASAIVGAAVAVAVAPFFPGLVKSDDVDIYLAFIVGAIFAVVYAMVWILQALRRAMSPLMGPAAFIANHMLWDVLDGTMTGDDSDHQLVGAGPTPQKLDAFQIRIDRETIGEMSPQVAERTLVHLYADSTAQASPRFDPVSTWRSISSSLYHNAYFSDAEVLELIASRIANGALREPLPAEDRVLT